MPKIKRIEKSIRVTKGVLAARIINYMSDNTQDMTTEQTDEMNRACSNMLRLFGINSKHLEEQRKLGENLLEDIRPCDKEVKLWQARRSVLLKERGIKSFEKKEYEEALNYFNMAVYANEEDPDAYIKRATAYVKLGKDAGAVADCFHALAAEENYHPALVLLGDIHYRCRQWQRAVAAYERAARVNKKDKSFFFRCHSAKVNLTEWQESVEKSLQEGHSRPLEGKYRLHRGKRAPPVKDPLTGREVIPLKPKVKPIEPRILLYYTPSREVYAPPKDEAEKNSINFVLRTNSSGDIKTMRAEGLPTGSAPDMRIGLPRVIPPTPKRLLERVVKGEVPKDDLFGVENLHREIFARLSAAELEQSQSTSATSADHRGETRKQSTRGRGVRRQ